MSRSKGSSAILLHGDAPRIAYPVNKRDVFAVYLLSLSWQRSPSPEGSG